MPLLSDNERQRIMLDLALALQHAVDLDSVLAHLLSTITGAFELPGAVVALVDGRAGLLHGWMGQNRGQETAVLLKRPPLSLGDKQHPLVGALNGRGTARVAPFAEFGMVDCLILPMRWGATPIGILLVELDGQPRDMEECATLEDIAGHAAVSIGMMQTRHRRATESAVQEERTRLALDLHDTVSQSLFGLVFALQACLRTLPDDPQAIKPELEWALKTAEEARRTIRETVSDLWPAELSAAQFEADLRSYAGDVLQAAELDITFDIRGDFGALSPPVRRSIYRISQEALANVIHHAGARESRICLDIADGRAIFIVRDNGRGFEPQVILTQAYSDDHFGLRGMQQRAAALGGTCRIYSQPDAGTSIVLDIPANLQAHHEQ